MKPVQVTAILLVATCVLTQRLSAGPLDAIRNFFGGRPQPQTHIHHPRPVHPKDSKDAKDVPNESPAPTVSPAPMMSPGDQQPNSSPAQNTLNNTNRPGKPSIAAAPLY
jgi:hypothetical protein